MTTTDKGPYRNDVRGPIVLKGIPKLPTMEEEFQGSRMKRFFFGMDLGIGISWTLLCGALIIPLTIWPSISGGIFYSIIFLALSSQFVEMALERSREKIQNANNGKMEEWFETVDDWYEERESLIKKSGYEVGVDYESIQDPRVFWSREISVHVPVPK